MIRVLIKCDSRLEPMLEDWAWFKDALSVGLDAPHVKDRMVTLLFDSLEQDGFQEELNIFASHQEGDIHSVVFETVNPEAWQEKWRENFKPLDIGSFRVVGEWEDIELNNKLIRVYPGQAFGTGQHQTTQLIVKYLEDKDLSGMTVLDAGCGTGILAIVAERLGATSIFGFDVDPDCEENMQRHLEINQSKHVTLAIGVLEDFEPKPCDVVLANITLNVLREVWPGLGPWLKPGGLLVSSGILVEQKEEAVNLLKSLNYQIKDINEDGEWLMIGAIKS